jgi:hypothetical protein
LIVLSKQVVTKACEIHQQQGSASGFAMNEYDHNRRVAKQMCQDFTWNNQPLHDGDCVAILDGNVVAVASHPDEAIATLRKLEPNPRLGMVIQVSHPTHNIIR